MSMNVKLITYTPDPEKVVAAAAKLCYSTSDIDSLMSGLTPDKVNVFLGKLTSLGHFSPLEHVSFTFGIEDVSRSLLAQITRHRVGASFSVQSQRYCDMSKSDMVTPYRIESDGEAMEVFRQAMQSADAAYRHLHKILEDKYTEELLVDEPCLTEMKARAKAAKMANEDARSVLPNACPTKMIVTMNARELYHFFQLRCCQRAQDEIRNLANKMLKLVYPIAPHIFADAGPACCAGACPEGGMSCGNALEMKHWYLALKNEWRAAQNENIQPD